MMRSRFSISLAFLCTFCAGSAFGQELIYGMTAASSGSSAAGLNLVSFNSNAPGTMLTNVPLTGVVSGQSLRSIDFRPSNRQLYAISSASTAAQLYTVNLTTGVLTPVGSGLTLPSTNARVEIEFDPASDVIRYIGGGTTNNNATINPNTGALISAQTTLAFVSGDPLAGGLPGIVGAAYSNNNTGAAAPTLYGYDLTSGALVRIGGPGGSPSPNLGQVTTISNPGSPLAFNAGFGMDISGATNTLYVTHDDPATGTVMSLYTRNLTTGAESVVGAYPSLFVTDISVFPLAAAIPEPPMALMFGFAMTTIAWIRRRAYLPHSPGNGETSIH
jgi:hypothetical protein